MTLFKRLIIILIISTGILSASVLKAQYTDPPFLKYLNHPWVDSVLKSLSVDQQIAQCIWVAGYSNRDVAHEVELTDLIRKYCIGGIVFFQGTAEKQAELTNYYQKVSKVPLIISMDAEWGVGMRLDNVEKFPYQMTLGAISDDSLIYRFGNAVAGQFKRLGMQVNFAPVVDININAQNPVINYRSFGENREKVLVKARMYMNGMQDNGIIATGKHFPGHGDTNTDSHLDLPVINHKKSRLDSIELFPFRNLIYEGIGAIMVAHLNLPAIDSTPGLPTTLSPLVVNGLLKDDLGFKGLIITDAMNMKGVTKYFKTGEADAMALAAGNDVAEFVTDVEATIRETKNYINLKKISKSDIEDKCRKVLALKYWSGLNKPQVIEKENINSDLSPFSSEALIRELYSNALTLLNNNTNIIPVKHLDSLKIATIAINRSKLSVFQKRLADYMPANHFFMNPSDSHSCDSILKLLKKYDLVIGGIFGLDQRPNMGFGIKPGMAELIGKLTSDNKTIITWFGNPYGIDKIPALEACNGLILAYQENDYTEDLAAQMIFGGIGAKGTLPVTINNKWQSGFGITTSDGFRTGYSLPENVGVSSCILTRKIDSLANFAIEKKAFPGCEVMVARKGKVIFSKSYGYQTYDNRTPVKEDDLFDLASVTKVSAGLPGLMLLDSQGKFSPDATLGSYLPVFKKSDKENLVMRDLLTHQAGFTPFISFWKETLKSDGNFKRRTFVYHPAKKYSQEVANGLYIYDGYKKKMFNEIKKSPLGEKKYVYSDLAFIIAPEIINVLSGEKWYDFVTKNVYNKIGAKELIFNPYNKFPETRIIPTEYDSLFRKQLLRGTVHDEGAAMLGGISGHAGLFATANDLMKVLELYRRMGNYGGEQIIAEDVLKEYTKVQFPENKNRRGLGFDKPLLNNSEVTAIEAYPAKSASPESFGHSGYTGTFVWVDPVSEISLVFLSNRVYPTRNNNLISELNIRSGILQSIYDSIRK